MLMVSLSMPRIDVTVLAIRSIWAKVASVFRNSAIAWARGTSRRLSRMKSWHRGGPPYEMGLGMGGGDRGPRRAG